MKWMPVPVLRRTGYKGESFMSGTQQLRAEKRVRQPMLLSEPG